VKRSLILVFLSGLLTAKSIPAVPRVGGGSAVPCESLSALTLPDMAIESALTVPGPSLAVSATQTLNDLPAFCRVIGVIKPAIRFEVWLPLESWNGKLQGVGNGGTAGTIPYGGMAGAIRRGYAAVATDTGHINKRAFDSTWALNRPELIVDFGYRAIHVTTLNAKQILAAFYGRQARYAYFVGCSKGGGQALMEAQRFPNDYDGFVAGDPANDVTRFYAGAHLWYSLATLKDPESYIPPAKVPILANAVNAACDELDGIKDGTLDDPRQCKFDPAVLLCKGAQDEQQCFSAKQVKAIKDIWSGSRDSSGELVFPGLVPGGEAGQGGWVPWVLGSAPFTSTHWTAAEGFFKYMVFDDPGWDFRTFNYEADLDRTIEKLGWKLDAIDPDLKAMQLRGGKIILYHGWSDPDISPLNSINYYESVVSKLGRRKTDSFFRLFMVPGMQHCGGGPGPNSFDMLAALELWVEKRIPPSRIIASHSTNGTVDRTRPLCPYPQTAVYTGKGSTDDGANFVCRSPRSQ
jgi:feruloyl esterase